ncbi:dihydrolipoamide acetyltransferase family protein [Streptomyces globisporus]|uniref:dihydrolipoamide acetyltransferase family protein n=1 Tax=Streptomyces globisporus TaxID=1908 RepID=UPI00378E730A
MSKQQQFLLPDVGEGLTEAEILNWSVRVGDTVEINQILVEIETAKAAVELPSPYEGVVQTLHVQEGETLPVGQPLITILSDSRDAAPAREAVPTPAAAALDRAALLVGYGPQEGSRTRRRRTPGSRPVSTEQTSAPPSPTPDTAAKPPVRKLAKDLGVDITTVPPTGPGDTVTRDDVHRAAEAACAPAAEPPAPQHSERPAETRIPIRGVRKHTAAAMVASAFTAPHVTEFMTVDMTATVALRDTVSVRREFTELRVTPLLFVARAFVLALRNTPEANASWDEDAQEIVLKQDVNLGIAAATERGLIVPNIKRADRLSLRGLAEAITSLTNTARAGKTLPQAMAGGSVTLTNVGVFGVDTGTPILNPGEAAILAIGAIRRTPWVVTDNSGAERIEPRWVTQLALSFDHRLVDGQQGSRLLADTAALLHNPGLAML